MGLFERDAYAMLTRVIDPAQPITVLDVGANTGQTALRVSEVFPRSRVYSFEPAPETFGTLRGAVAGLANVTPIQLAVGARSGWLELQLAQDPQFTSALKPTANGLAYHPGVINTLGTARVPVVTLDEWTQENRLGGADILKVDVQGFEMEVFRGASRLLAGGSIVAINSEAQLCPEYQGAATFSEIDLYLRDFGFVLHQIHELWDHGDERQHSCLDALWLRADALEWLREEPREAYKVDWRRRMARAMASLASEGRRRVALYGAGLHTRETAAALEGTAARVVAVIDDHPKNQGQSVIGRPVVSQESAIAMGVEAVVLSSNAHEAAMWKASRPLREAGVRVVALYGTYEEEAQAAGVGAAVAV